MSVNDALSKRMKTFYETIPKNKLMRRCPVIIRLDGKTFHTFTKGFQRPFDAILSKTMQETMKYLCENIQGCVLGYTQSDEISLLLIDYQNIDTAAWFDYKVQKMCSIAASMATLAFNRFFKINTDLFVYNNGENYIKDSQEYKLCQSYCNARAKGAMFDARCFNIPKEEVTNYFYWRQADATRNSIQMLGQAYFSHNQLKNKSVNNIQDMLMLEKGINWNNCLTYQKRGSCCIKKIFQNENVDIKDGPCIRKKWVIDIEIPIFKNEDRNYIEQLVYI